MQEDGLNLETGPVLRMQNTIESYRGIQRSKVVLLSRDYKQPERQRVDGDDDVLMWIIYFTSLFSLL